MQYMKTTDDAISIMCYLARNHGYRNSDEISKQTGITRDFVSKIILKLKRSKLISTQMGREGGYALARFAKDISMAEIIECIEGTLKLNKCLEDGHKCTQGSYEICKTRKFFEAMQEQYEKMLKGTSLEDITEKNDFRAIA